MEGIVKTCCFTGHREERLAGKEDELREKLEIEIDEAILCGVKIFISGMASGFDTWAAEAVLKRKDRGVSLICAVPYDGFCKNCKILAEADVVHYISKQYYHQIFYERNKWMVDRSDLVIACYDGGDGGTRQTVKYAEKSGKKIINILMPDTLWIE